MKKKQSIVVLLVLCLLAMFAVAGCGQSDSNSANNNEGDSSKELPNVTLKLQCAYSPPEYSIEGYDYMGGYGYSLMMAKEVKEKTDGKLTIEVYPPDALFKSAEIPDAIQSGAIDMACSNGSYHSNIVPEGNLESGLPYGTETVEQCIDLIFGNGGEYYNIIRKAYADKHNVYHLGLFTSGGQNFITSFPITKIDDFNGKRIRATGVQGAVVKALGGVPVNIMPSEQYMALQRKTIDGTTYPAYCGISYKMFEVAPHQSWPCFYSSQNQNFLVNLDVWNDLPKEYQVALQEAMDDILKYGIEKSAPGLEEIAKKMGVEDYNSVVTVLSDEEFKKCADATRPVWDELAAKSPESAKLVEIAKKYIEQNVGGNK